MKFIIGIIAILIASQIATAQLPNTNIYTLELKANEQKVLLNNPIFITEFNKGGYNNQPFFINDDELYITSDYKSSGLTDILHLNLSSAIVTKITQTEESEYSPTLLEKQATFSVVRQELDDIQPVPQILWMYPIDRSSIGEAIISDLQNIGYHIWLTSNKVALYLVDSPSKLVIYDTKFKTITPVARNVGRCLKSDDSGLLYYTSQSDSGTHIYTFDIYLGKSKTVAPMIANQVDFEILPNGHFICADGSKLKTLNPRAEDNWKEVFDLKGAGVNHISRIASSFNKIAIVTSPN